MFPFTLSRELLRVVTKKLWEPGAGTGRGAKVQGAADSAAQASRGTVISLVMCSCVRMYLYRRITPTLPGFYNIQQQRTALADAAAGEPLVIKRGWPRITTVSSLAAVTRDHILQRKEVERDPSMKSASSTSTKIYHCHQELSFFLIMWAFITLWLWKT